MNKISLTVVIMALVSLTPVIAATQLGFIPNVRYSWENFYSMDYFEVSSSSGSINVGKDWLSIGTTESDVSSSVTLGSGFWPYYDFLRVRNQTSSYLALKVERPVSKFLEFREVNATWEDDNFIANWTRYANASQDGSAETGEGILDVHANFASGERSYFLLKTDLPDINSSEIPYVFVRWKSTDHVARFDVHDSTGDDYKVVAESADGVMYAGTYGGGYSSNWTKTMLRFPPNKTLTWIALGIDSGGGGGGPFPVLGPQHAYFDYVKFALSGIETSNMKIVLNNQILLDENFTYPIGPGLYSVDPLKFKSEYIEIPFNASVIQEENFLTISVGKETNFNISSPTIRMLTKLEGVKPAWTETPYLAPLLYVATIAEIAVAFYMANKLRHWIRRQEHSAEPKV